MKTVFLTSFFSNSTLLKVMEIELELHGIFWFHTFAQPRDKYTHILIPVVHNYPLTLALLGFPSEAYTSVSGIKTFTYKPEHIWERHGFYVYPAIAVKMVSKALTFSMGGTGYVQFKPQTRASVPDYTTNQILFPGTKLKTYIIARGGYSPPSFIRLGSKRYGVFKTKVKRRWAGQVEDSGNKAVTHPFNARDVGAFKYHAVLRHYAGAIAISGAVDRVVIAGDAVLALPKFIKGGEP